MTKTGGAEFFLATPYADSRFSKEFSWEIPLEAFGEPF